MRTVNPLSKYCVKSVRVGSFTDSYFRTFEPNTEISRVNLRIHSECGKIWTREIPITDTLYAVKKKSFIML